MGFDDYVSESEAASLASVSVQTLRRFVEAGYLRGETDGDGVRLFSKSDVAGLFGLKSNQLERRAPVSDPSPARPATVDSPETTSSMTTETLAAQVEVHSEIASATELFQESPEVESPRADLSAAMSAEVLDAPEAPRATPEAAPTAPVQQSTVDSIELLKLRTVVDLQEKILALKEQEISSLRSERDWLRTRIEKLEDKQDRDQLILLTETQMIRKLVARNEPKPSGLRLALEWLGLAPSSNSQIQHDSVMTDRRER